MEHMNFNYKTTKIKGDVIVHGKIILENGAKIFMTGCVAPTAYPFLYPVKADLEKKEGMHIYGDLVLENETWLVDGSVLGMVSGQMKAGSLTKPISKEELENFMSMSYDERILSSIIRDAEKCMALTSEQMEWLKNLKAKPVDIPKWRKIKAGEYLPCEAYLWSCTYGPNCGNWWGRLIPNIAGVEVGMDTWYLPATEVRDLPREE